MGPVQYALHNRLATFVLAVGLVALGIYSFRQLKLEAYPDISDTGVVVITVFPGNASEEVEQQVTIPIERALNNVPQVIARRSRTIFGLSVVELTFADGTDDYFARQVVLEKLRDAELPDGITPSLGPLSTGISEFYRFVLEGPEYDDMALREFQDWIVVPHLSQVPGVAEVVVFGGLVKQYQIEVDPFALEKYRLTIADVARAVETNNRNAGGAVVSSGQQGMVVRGIGLIQSVQDIEHIALKEAAGVPVLLREIGRVSIGAAQRTGIFGLNEHTGGVEGIVLMRRWENPSEVLNAIHAAVEDLNATRLPEGVRIVPIHDRTELVGNTLRTIARTLSEALVIVVLVLSLMLGSVRAALVCAATIPLSLLFAFVCMHAVGIPANLLSLGALDFGIIVDGNLVMVQHILRRLGERKSDLGHGTTIDDLIRRAAMEMQRPVFFSLAIIIAAYLPLFALERVERRLFTPMAYTVCFALFGALLLALTVVPVLAAWVFRHGARTWRNPVLEWLFDRYESAVRWTLVHTRLVIGTASGLVGLAVMVASALGTEFLPQLDEGVIWIRSNLPPGISLEESANTATRMRELIRQSPEVKMVMSQTGRNDSGMDPFGPNRNELLIEMIPYSQWPRGRTKRDLVRELSERLNTHIPGATFNVTQPIIDTSTEIATGSSADLAVIVAGPDLLELRRLAGEMLEVIRTVPGAADTSIEQEADQPQLRIAVDRAVLARYGVNISDVQDVIELAIGGRAVGAVFEDERKFDVTVRYVPDARTDVTVIGQLLVATPAGGRVPLGQLAQIETVRGPSIIGRRENQRQITVRSNIRDRDQGGFVSEAQAKVAAAVPLPPGYRVSWGGQFENLARARARLAVLLPLTIIIVFGLLFVAFASVRDAALVLLNVPFSFVGGVVALYLRDMYLSVSAAVGFITLFGVAVMSGLLYIAEINRRLAEPDVSLEEAVVAGAKSQVRPRFMLILVAMFGMIPAATATGIGSDIQRPLATVVVGGLASTLLLTLFVLPSLYYRTAGGQRPPTGRD
ncbi:MAG: efflux RND transporter permease subunit [Vicinamibacterales bacterium]